MRRSWLTGLAEVTKHYLVATAAHNLGRSLWKLVAIGKPRSLQETGGLEAVLGVLWRFLQRPHHCLSEIHSAKAPTVCLAR